MSDNRSDLSSMLGKVISNPEAMQTIMKIAGELKDAKTTRRRKIASACLSL